ncbi:DUF7711 family protein [Kineococcus radiotolerans]|uniref:DUF7711 domain-containing protein n=1 Tax=Kineococcus radiotolerans (strain ATCC BAA-149 / DSM 14245 / SRS30216) TaxID=266940 RepID=A6WE73_KINRD|nr:hypothetical protein [Kineococcus radiotolerans]ABS05112.1 hypothetical protein Krad_3649 [Kineococcus radiotolerans SRS30216 = ATCC BAA-149]
MKWTTAVSKLAEVAAGCEHARTLPAGLVGFQAEEAWVFGSLLGPRREQVDDLTGVGVALAVDLPESDCALFTRPPAGEHWLNAAGLAKLPVRLLFRSGRAPVWNHVVERPVRFWSHADGLDHEVLLQLRSGDGEALRPEAPAPGELRERLDRDLAASLAALARTTRAYDEKRWSPGSPKKRGDALCDAALGYVDLRAARDSLGG